MKHQNPTPSGKKPFYKKWWFVLICVFSVIGAIGNIGKDDSPTVESSVAESSVVESSVVESSVVESSVVESSVVESSVVEISVVESSVVESSVVESSVVESSVVESSAPESSKAESSPLSSSTSSSGGGSSHANTEYNGKTVYVTPTGSKYHYANPCGSGSYSPIALDKAIASGYEPCKSCVL